VQAEHFTEETMSVINTNIQSLVAQNALRQNNSAQATSLERLSTGLRINRGADDPSGLIASQDLKSETTGLNAAIDNANRADNIIGTADGGLGEVSNLLTSLQGLVSQSANTGGLSTAEVAANQSQVDSIISTINRIAGSTSFSGKQLLNGDLSYTTSGVASTAFTDLSINSALVPDNGSVSVVLAVTASATTAKVGYTGGAVTGTNGVTISVTGNTGTQELSFASGTTVSSIAASINAVVSETGVSAVVSGTSLNIDSTSLGSAQFVSVKAVTGTFATVGGTAGRSTGTDAKVTVNGSAAVVTGTAVAFDDQSLGLTLNLTSAFNKPGTTTFDITGGGATFAIGDKVTESGKASIGIGDISAASLGDATNGYLSSLTSDGVNSLSSENLDTAQKIVDEAVNQVSSVRGRLGAFQTDTLSSTINSLNVAFENASSANSSIEDANFAQETANLTRDEILVQSATTVLSQANSAPKNALTLLQNV
jgi:flagellin